MLSHYSIMVLNVLPESVDQHMPQLMYVIDVDVTEAPQSLQQTQ